MAKLDYSKCRKPGRKYLSDAIWQAKVKAAMEAFKKERSKKKKRIQRV